MMSCKAYKQCKTKCLRKHLINHQGVCEFVILQCEFCKKKDILRGDLQEHFLTCDSCFTCERCRCQVDTKSERGKNHDCIEALSFKMDMYMKDKDSLVAHLMLDLRKKDEVSRELVTKFAFLERKLLKNNDISNTFKEEYVDFTEMQKERQDIERDSSFSLSGLRQSDSKTTELLSKSSRQSDSRSSWKSETKCILRDGDETHHDAMAEKLAEMNRGSSGRSIESIKNIEEQLVVMEEAANKSLDQLYGLDDDFENKLKQIEDLQIQNKVKEAREPIYKLIELIKSEDWQHLETQNNVEIKNKTGIEGSLCVYSKTIFNYTIEQICKVLLDPELNKSYDEMLEEQQVIEEFPLNSFTLYNKYKNILEVSPRDFTLRGCYVDVRMITKISNGTRILSLASCVLPDYPETDQAVRAYLKCGGWMLIPLTDGTTEAHFALESNLKGSIPNFVISSTASKIGLIPEKVKEVISKQLGY